MEDKTQDDKILPGLHPDHLKDLKKSGLSDETILEAEIYSVPPGEISKILSPGLGIKVNSLLAFPYPGCDEFIQYKPFPPAINKDGHTIRYFQPPGSSNHLYIPKQVISVLQDIFISLYITEGTKKALKACQDGLPCIALAGLWNWSDGSEDKNLIPDFDKVTLRGREISIVPDNDWLSPDHHGEPKNLKKAVYEFAYRLIDRGAKVYIVQLPEGPLKGLDDYLCRHSVEKFKKLLKLEVRKHTLNEMIEGGLQDDLYDILKRMAPLREVEKEIYIGKLSKKFRISRHQLRRISKRLKVKELEGMKRLKNSLIPNPQSKPDFQQWSLLMINYLMGEFGTVKRFFLSQMVKLFHQTPSIYSNSLDPG